MGYFTDFTAMGTGSSAGTSPSAAINPLTLLTDTIPGDTTTSANLLVGGAHQFSTINSLGDFDFFRVTLSAGQFYEFGMYAAVAGPSGVPLNDSLLQIYDGAGHLLGEADGGATTQLNTINSGFDALLSFTAPADGVYFLNARAFDQDPTNGANGDGVGDYEIFARTADPASAYHARYDIDSPLHSIDWGTQVDRTSRNPDGDNGPRDNGAPFHGTTFDPTYGVSGKNVITYYFARTGDLFVDENPATPGSTDTMVALGMADWEKAAFRQVLDLYSQVADITYIEVASREEADFKFITYKGTPGAGASLLGRMSPPDTENEGQAEFNAGDMRWTQEGLAQGGFYFPTLIHELGHGHGMAHPHDNGGHSSVMRGSEDGSVIGGATADFDLSQQVFTIMSYNDGWTTSPYGQPSAGDVLAMGADPYGWMGTLGALDIAVIQDKYGVNEDWAKGDDVYVIKDANAVGTFYSAIWDAGGTDEIRYGGAADANIDLRAATLQYEYGGGGWVSYATGVFGGFTIANGVTIENATSGSGNDTLTGNAAANKLTSGAGDDVLIGGAGADRLDGGAGFDTVSYRTATASVTLSVGTQASGDAAGDVFTSIEAYELTGFNDIFSGTALAETVHGGGGNDVLSAGDGADKVWGDAGDDQVTGGNGADQFWFAAGFGHDLVTDYRDGQDKIGFAGITGVDDFSDLTISTELRGGVAGALVTFGDGANTVWLRLALATSLHADDFLFG